MSKKDLTLGWIAAIFVGLLWGIPWIVGTPILEVMDAQMLVWVRYTVAFISLGIIMAIGLSTKKLERKEKFELSWANKSDIFWTAACGIIGQGAFSYLSFLSLDTNALGNGAISGQENGVIQGLIPIIILLVGFLRHGARFTFLQILAAIGAFIGVVILVFDPNVETSGFKIGHLICLISACSFACLAYARDKLAKKYGSFATMFHQFVFASIGFGIFLAINGADFSTALNVFSSPLRILCITILGVGISGISYVIYIYGMQKVGVDGTGMALNLMPLSSFVLAVVALNEPLTAVRVTAMLIVIISMMMFIKFAKKGEK